MRADTHDRRKANPRRVSQPMSKAALVQILDRWTGSHESDVDSGFLTRYLTERDEDAFASLVRRHGALVYGTCQRMLGNRADTDDAFQAVFFVLARRAHTLKLDRGIGPWLHGVALRVAKKLRGQIVRRRSREMAAAKCERVEATEPGHDFWAVIDEELARMSPPLREVLLLCDLSGQSHSQAAKSLGVAKGTVTKRLAKARDRLASQLKRRGIAPGDRCLVTHGRDECDCVGPPTPFTRNRQTGGGVRGWRRGGVARGPNSGGGRHAFTRSRHTQNVALHRTTRDGGRRRWSHTGWRAWRFR